MIILENYSFFVDKKISKNKNEYYALYLQVGEKTLFLKYITSSFYEYISSLSK